MASPYPMYRNPKENLAQSATRHSLQMGHSSGLLPSLFPCTIAFRIVTILPLIGEFCDLLGSYEPYHFWDYIMGPRGHTVLQNPIPRQQAHIPGLVKITFPFESSGGRWQEESREKMNKVNDIHP